MRGRPSTRLPRRSPRCGLDGGQQPHHTLLPAPGVLLPAGAAALAAGTE